MEMNYCRRCGTELVFQPKEHVFKCSNGHDVFRNPAPGANVFIYDEMGRVLIGERAVDPGMGMLDVPGGFSEIGETLEDTIHREIKEETGLPPEAYEITGYLGSGVDGYEYKGETFDILCMVFMVRLHAGYVISAHDDFKNARFVGADQLIPEEFYSITLRHLIPELQQKLT